MISRYDPLNEIDDVEDNLDEDTLSEQICFYKPITNFKKYDTESRI